MNALSENTYVGTTRRDITHVDREAGLVAYTLPTAAEDVKGGVMIGGGLSMDGDTLNCTISSGTLSEASTTAKGLMSADDKVKLNGISAGAQVNVIESIIIDGTPQTVTDKSVELNLLGYVKKSDISGVYKFKGTVGSLSGLSSTGNEVGDVYNVSVGGGSDFQGVEIKAGDNVAWNGTGWDALAGIVDLSELQYSLPTASTSVKGGVVIGEGLSMAGDTVYVTLQSGETYSDATTVASGLMSASDKVKLNGIDTGANNYTLPTASTSTKGGVKVGTGLSMNGDSLNCTVSGGSYTLPTASSTTKGGVKIGSGLSMNNDTLNCTIASGVILSTVYSEVEGAMWLSFS